MSIADSVAKTARRIGSVGRILAGPGVKALYDGLSVEFGRVAAYRDIVRRATVPSADVPIETLDDLEGKYGIALYGESNDQERIDRIVERATLFGSGGAGWLQAQIQAAGFPLYVIENTPTPGIRTQFGDVQFNDTTQFGTLPSRIDPRTVPGVLITGSPNRKGGGVIAGSSQWGLAQFGASTQFGTLDENFSYPQPATRTLPADPSLWGGVFFLSPIEGRLATEAEMLFISDERIRYLRKLITQIKYLGKWCVAQVATRIIRVTEEGEVRLTEDDFIRRA